MYGQIETASFPYAIREEVRSLCPALWYAGNLDLLKRPMASVVGPRRCSEQAKQYAFEVTQALVCLGFCIVSGLAEGVDTVAHQAALELGGGTVAVMGTPIDECFPKSNQRLKNSIEERGLVLSQFEIGQPVYRSNFPRRNAVMAALSKLTVVVEPTHKSGTKHQVAAAIKFGRRVGFIAMRQELKGTWMDEALESGIAEILADDRDVIGVANQILRGSRRGGKFDSRPPI